MRPLRAPVAVTGATGFIGRHLVSRLLALDLPTRALVLPEETVPAEFEGVEIGREMAAHPIGADQHQGPNGVERRLTHAGAADRLV